MTLDHVWLAAALILLALRPLLTVIPPNDFWWHMAVGRAIVEQGAIPPVDAFSFTRGGAPFFNQAWLAQLLMYGLYSLGGLPLILIAQALVIALAYGLLLRLMLLRTGRVKLCVALLLLTTMPLSFDNWSVRPQSYVFPLFAGFLTVLTEHRLGRASRLWLLPPLMALWVNMHGSFVLGLALIGITFVGEALKSLRGGASAFSVQRSAFLLWGALTALATLLNPRGPGVLAYVSNLLGSNQVTQLVVEWAPPTVRDINGAIFFLFVIALAAVLAYARRRPDLTDMLLAGAFLWLALGAMRNVVWFGFVATPLLAVQTATLLPPPPARRPAGSPTLNAALIGALALLLVIGSPWLKPALLPPAVGALLLDDTPVAAVRALKALPQRPARLFHAMGYGSYLIWAAPEQPVFIDPRIELYPFAQWRDYINLGQANNVDQLLEKYAIDGALLSIREQRPLVDHLRRDARWTLHYEDEYSALFTRSP
ncbi:MAG TPA: hypothetical protein VNL77_12830 [Roseiflexaceae bacterium]|nr:hypothetical protein [Roseiflexaceae bacterium]